MAVWPSGNIGRQQGEFLVTDIQSLKPSGAHGLDVHYILKSLLRRLHAQTLRDATPPMGEVPPIQKNCYNF